MPTASDLVQETRAHLLSGAKTEMNYLAGAIDASTQTVTLALDMGGVQRGAVLSIDLELMYVFGIGGQVATVFRGWLGSTAAAHSNNAQVEVNPRHSNFQILRAINQELVSYSSPAWGLFRVRTVDLTFSSARATYDLTGVTDLIDIIDVRYEAVGASRTWPRVPRWNLARDQDTTDFASGYALTVLSPVDPGRTMRVQYRAPFGSFTTLAQDVVTQTGLPTTAHDIPPLGAAARLVAPREVPRANLGSQPEPRQAADVPPGANRQAAAALLEMRRQRLEEEAARLRAQYPSLRKVV